MERRFLWGVLSVLREGSFFTQIKLRVCSLIRILLEPASKRSLLVGIPTSGVAFPIFYVLMECRGFPPWYALSWAAVVVLIPSFLAQKYVAFRNKDIKKMRKQGLLFSLWTFFTLGVNIGLLFVLEFLFEEGEGKVLLFVAIEVVVALIITAMNIIVRRRIFRKLN